MAQEHTFLFCKECNKRGRFERVGVSHILHLLLSIITMGFWGIVWLVLCFTKVPWRCSTCGHVWNKEEEPKAS